MQYMNTYHITPEDRDACIARFKKGGGQTPDGVKLLGRWHDVAGRRGFTLIESDDPVAVGKFASKRSINRVPCSTSSDVIGVGGQAARSYSDVSAIFHGSSAS